MRRVGVGVVRLGDRLWDRLWDQLGKSIQEDLCDE